VVKLTNFADNDMYAAEVMEDSQPTLYLGFVIDSEHFAIDISNIKEIIGVEPIAFVPQTERYIKGILNLRGEIVPVIDVRLRFMKPEKEYTDETCIVVVLYQDYILGLIVDSILGVYPIAQDMIAAPPSANSNYYNQFVKNIGRCDDGIKLLLDLERLIF
jgi:purine-binding chemotaxis protein CheW